MSNLRHSLQALLGAADFPAEILGGIPSVEVHGDAEAVILKHRGVEAYDPARVRIATALGPVTVQGEGLTVYRMNRERIVLHGRVFCVRIGEETV